MRINPPTSTVPLFPVGSEAWGAQSGWIAVSNSPSVESLLRLLVEASSLSNQELYGRQSMRLCEQEAKKQTCLWVMRETVNGATHIICVPFPQIYLSLVFHSGPSKSLIIPPKHWPQLMNQNIIACLAISPSRQSKQPGVWLMSSQWEDFPSPQSCGCSRRRLQCRNCLPSGSICVPCRTSFKLGAHLLFLCQWILENCQWGNSFRLRERWQGEGHGTWALS